MESPPSRPSDIPPELTAAVAAWRGRLRVRLAELARARARTSARA